MTWFHWFLIVMIFLFLACVLPGFYYSTRVWDLQHGNAQAKYSGEEKECEQIGDGFISGAVILFIIMFMVVVVRTVILKLMG